MQSLTDHGNKGLTVVDTEQEVEISVSIGTQDLSRVSFLCVVRKTLQT